jgi:ParB-like chromosome segregation protein Spo0J
VFADKALTTHDDLLEGDEARDVRDRQHLRAGETARDARSQAQEIAESILQVGLQSPILVRQDGERFVLVEGLHRLEACKQLGEETIVGYVVRARRH